MTAALAARASMWRAPFVWLSVGVIALVFLAALQTLAVTTVMPVVSDELAGEPLYALAFSGTLATSVVGMVVAGGWSDRTGPAAPLSTAVALFVVGLVIAGVAPSMVALVLGRLVQGLGVGGVTVALYVVVARAYPAQLHPRVFAAFSAAWVVPSLLGPSAAGAVAEYLHWRWVFLGVAVLAVLAFAMLARRVLVLDRQDGHDEENGDVAPAAFLPRLVRALIAALALIALSLAGEAGPWAPVAAAAAIAVLALALRGLLPNGTFRAARGLPSTILLRGVLAGAFFGAEVYVPHLFIAQYRFSPVWAGLALTVAALTWAVASDVQGRAGAHWHPRRVALWGSGMLVASLGVVTLAALLSLHPALLIGAWALGGAGLGLVYPRLSVLTLAASTPRDQGFNSAALSISDAAGGAAGIAVLGLVFAALDGGAPAYGGVFLVAAAIACLAALPALRVGAPTLRAAAEVGGAVAVPER